MTKCRCAVAMVLWLSLAGVAAAQETTGTLIGRLTDPQGLALPGVTVTITGPQGARSVVTETDGTYRVPFLTPGTYDVRAVAIHGGRNQNQRDRALEQFRAGRARAIVATDVAARGIHVDGVACIVFTPELASRSSRHLASLATSREVTTSRAPVTSGR